MLKAIGKIIDTLPIEKLFSQEEIRADKIVIEVDRFHDGYDLTEFTFIMRGITESGGETESALLMTESDENTVRLFWEVGKEFTAEAGTLSLDLFACHYVADSDPLETDALIRYQLPPVKVRALPDSNHTLDSQSYTEFLLQVRNAAEENLAEINAIVEQFRSDFSVALIDERLELLETLTTTQLQALNNLVLPIEYYQNS